MMHSHSTESRGQFECGSKGLHLIFHQRQHAEASKQANPDDNNSIPISHEDRGDYPRGGLPLER